MYRSRSRTMFVTLIALLAGLLAVVPGSAAARALPAAQLSPQGTTLKAASAGSAGSDISPATVLARGQYWVNQNVPYNQGAAHPASSAPYGPYRTDCSGFVSMAWGLSSSLTTWTLPSVSTEISYSQLQPGDILDYNSHTNPQNGSHVVLFVGWANSQHTEYTEDEEAGGLGAVQRTIAFPYDAQLSGGQWIAYHYSKMMAPSSYVGMASLSSGKGYWLAGSDGGVFSFGGAHFYGSLGGQQLNAPIVGMAATPDGKGYWLVGSDGGVFAFGDAGYYGSLAGVHLNAPIVGIASSSDGKGYELVGSDGGVFNYGDAQFDGSMGGQHLNAPVVGIAVDRTTGGYWLVGSDGGLYAFNAPFDGSLGGDQLAAPIVGMAPTPDSRGYWMAGSDGGVFSFGDAHFYGSMGGQHLNAPIVAISTDLATGGYWLVGADGGVFSFNAPFYGSGTGIQP